MSPNSGLRAYVLVSIIVAMSVGAAQGQIRFLPGSEYHAAIIRPPQAIVSRVDALRQNNEFERLSDFKVDSRYRQASGPVGRLKMRVRDQSGRNGTALCTGSLISREHLLTNFHCVPGIAGVTVLEAKVEFNYLSEQEIGAVASFQLETPPVESDERLDYAVLRVRGTPGARFGVVTIAREPPQVRDTLFVIGHPEGQPQTLSRKGCQVKVAQADEFVHSCDTLGGSSGSPVFSDNTLEVVGLHYAGGAEGNHGKNIAALLRHSRILEGVAVLAKQPAPGRLPEPRSVSIAMDSRPAGALVYYEGTLLGTTPLSFAVAPAKQFLFTLRKNSFQNEDVRLDGSGALSRTVELRPALGAASGPPRPSAQAPTGNHAADQVARALAFWASMEAPGQAPPSGGGAAEEQQRKGDEFFKQFGR